MVVPANHEYPTVAGTAVGVVWVQCVLCAAVCVSVCECWLRILAVRANHEYPTVAITVVCTACLCVMLSIGIAWKVPLVG